MTLQQWRYLADKKPLWWAIALVLLALSGPFLSNSALTIVSICCIFTAINLLWTLIIGTAGIFSLATLALVGIGAYAERAVDLPLPTVLAVKRQLTQVGSFARTDDPEERLDGLKSFTPSPISSPPPPRPSASRSWAAGQSTVPWASALASTPMATWPCGFATAPMSMRSAPKSP